MTAADLALPQRRVSGFSPLTIPLAVSRALPALQACGGLRIRGAQAAVKTSILGRLGSLGIRLASNAKEVRQAQRLRYQVFYEEMSAVPSSLMTLARRDIDSYDAICDHLLVFDDCIGLDRRSGLQTVVGTYRLLRHRIAQRNGGFYSANEFDLSALLAHQRDLNFLELGRSCVLAGYRNKRTIELLWRGIWIYLVHHRCDVMIGCASFDGTDSDKLALPLSFLHHFAAAPPEWRATALPGRYVEMNRMPKDRIDAKKALRELPPLIKGYLRIGAFVGDSAVIDHRFGTTDVFMILPVSLIQPRYINHFGSDTEQQALACA